MNTNKYCHLYETREFSNEEYMSDKDITLTARRILAQILSYTSSSRVFCFVVVYDFFVFLFVLPGAIHFSLTPT